MKTPIINHFSETFNGLEVIRALDQSITFLNVLFQRIDAHTNIFLISNASNRWLGIMLVSTYKREFHFYFTGHLRSMCAGLPWRNNTFRYNDPGTTHRFPRTGFEDIHVFWLGYKLHASGTNLSYVGGEILDRFGYLYGGCGSDSQFLKIIQRRI